MKRRGNLLEKRLKTYSESITQYHSSKVGNAALLLTASAAAGMGALICPPPAEAAVQYSGSQRIPLGTNVPPQVHEIDLDGDGIADFFIDFGHYSYNYSIDSMRLELEANVFFFSAATGNRVLALPSTGISSTGTGLPARLPENYTIQSGIPVSASNQWSTGGSYGILAAKEQYYGAHFSAAAGTMVVDLDASSQTGEFTGKKGYIGVRFQISGQTHYGWIQFVSDENMKNGRIIDWAYEDEADKPLRAGQGRFKWSLIMPSILNGVNHNSP